jgi:hypothetical protein
MYDVLLIKILLPKITQMSTSVFSTINSVVLAFALNDMLTLFDAQVLVIKVCNHCRLGVSTAFNEILLLLAEG